MELQKTLKTHFVLNLSAFNKFYLSVAFSGLFWLRSDSCKVVLIINEYLNIYCTIISLRDALELKKTLKTHFAKKLSPFNNLCLNRAFKELFLHKSDSSKVVLNPNEYSNILYIITSLRDSF